jgi:hypothetical protein
MQPEIGVFALSYLLILLGLIGSVLPIVPGPLFIWLGALTWAIADDFQAVGWPTLIIMGVLMIIGWGSDLILTTIATRSAGGGWKAVIGAILFGLLGGILFTGLLPIVGSIVGTVLGAVVGILLVEYREKQDWGHALRAGRGYVAGYLMAVALELVLSLLMLALFVWQAFL